MLIRRILSLALPVLVAGCASIPADRGREDVAAMLKPRGLELPAADAAAKALLAELASKPLTTAAAVRLALVNNAAVRAQYAELGVASAEIYEAGRLSNPTLSASVLFPSEADSGNETTLGLAQNFTDLLLLGARSRLAQAEFERAKLIVAAETLDLAADTEAAWYELVGAQQVARMREAVAKAAGASAELAQRFFDAGNISKLELVRERAAATQARLDSLDAQVDVASARAELGELLGLRAADWSVDERLASPPAQEDGLAMLIRKADQGRFDLVAARKEVAALSDALGISRRFRFLGDVEIGVETTRLDDGGRLTGPTLSLQLPIFNQGLGAVMRSEVQLELAQADLAMLEARIANGIHRAHSRLQHARLRVDQYKTALIPQREEIVERTQEQLNYMLVGQFELLLAKQEEYDAYQGYLEAVRDYWLARVELTRQVGAPLPSSSDIGTAEIEVDSLIAPKAPPMSHGTSMEGMDHGEIDHSQHGAPAAAKPDGHDSHGQKPAASKKPPKPKPDDKPSMPGHDQPAGMEGHIPETSSPSRAPEDESHQHGDHR